MAKLTIGFEVPRKDGSRRVIYTLSHKGSRKRVQSCIELSSTEVTKDKKGNLKVKSDAKRYEIERELRVYNDRLHDLRKESVGVDLTIDEVYNYIIKSRRSEELEFFSFAEEWLASTDIKGKKNYITMLNSLEKHLEIRYLPFSKIDYAFLVKYQTSLKDKPRAQSLYLGAIRHIYKQALLTYNTDTKTLISPMLFEKFKVPKQQMKGQRAISIDHLRRIIAYEGTGRAGLARDCFVLSFLTMGMNSADMFDKDAKIINGKICYHRKKTRDRRSDDAYIEVDILEETAILIKKYRGSSRLFDFSKRYSSESQFNRAINKGLKIVEREINTIIKEENQNRKKDKIAEIEGLQFYQARHTWASIARNELGIDAYTIDSALNHLNKNLSLLDVYIKKDFTQINEANKRVVNYVSEPLTK